MGRRLRFVLVGCVAAAAIFASTPAYDAGSAATANPERATTATAVPVGAASLADAGVQRAADRSAKRTQTFTVVGASVLLLVLAFAWPLSGAPREQRRPGRRLVVAIRGPPATAAL